MLIAQAKELRIMLELNLSNVRQCPNEENIIDAFKAVEKVLTVLLDDLHNRLGGN